MSLAYNTLGNIDIDVKNRDDALKMYDSANKIAVRYSIPKQIGLSLGNLALFEKDPVKEVKLEKEAIRYLIKNKGNEEGLARIYINMGFRATNPDTALFYYKKALKITRNNNLAEVEMAAYNNMVYSYLDKGDNKGSRNMPGGPCHPACRGREK